MRWYISPAEGERGEAWVAIKADALRLAAWLAAEAGQAVWVANGHPWSKSRPVKVSVSA